MHPIIEGHRPEEMVQWQGPRFTAGGAHGQKLAQQARHGGGRTRAPSGCQEGLGGQGRRPAFRQPGPGWDRGGFGGLLGHGSLGRNAYNRDIRGGIVEPHAGFEVIHPDDLATARQLWQELLSQPEAVRHLEFRIRHENGTWIWAEASVSNLLANPDVRAVVATIRDVTERKGDEAERVRLQARLLQSQKLDSIGQLAGGVAHDFNNMLSVILSNSELALCQVGPGHPAGEKLELIVKATQRSADLTRQLLAFARQQPALPKVLDLNFAIEGMLRMLSRIIGEDIAIAWIPSLRLWRTFMDPTQLDQILANLLVNARDAIKGEGKVTITTQNVHLEQGWSDLRMEARTGDFVLLTISDDGCGMDEETQKRIFEPFFTTKGMDQGTGLGLATVYGSVRQSGGFINVYSEPRLGTTFKIYLPRHLGAEQEPAARVAVADLPRGTETVVLVEDNSVLLQSISAVLGALGYNVFPLSEPREAIRLAQEYPGTLHLLLTDVVMPGMNGHDLMLAFESVRPGSKSLLMSGYTAEVISRQGILKEGLQFIQKPFSSQEIAKKLRNVLDGARA